MATRPFQVNKRLTAISLAFSNPDLVLIGDQVLPATPVAEKFSWKSYAPEQAYTVPDTKVGRTSRPNEVEFNATDVEDAVVDHGLDDYVPLTDVTADVDGFDPLGTATNWTTKLVKLAREIRVANMVFNNANYVAGQKVVLSGTGQWSDYTNSNPSGVINDALDACIMRPNIAVFGQRSWTLTRQNPKLVQAILGMNTAAGQVTRQQFADYFELQEVLVGSGFVNTAKRGQPTAAMNRVWGKHVSFIYRDRQAGPQAGLTYGFTGENQSRFVREKLDEDRGLNGAYRIRVGERVKEVICAPSCGYYFENAVA
jgi:hypothetical protein